MTTKSVSFKTNRMDELQNYPHLYYIKNRDRLLAKSKLYYITKGIDRNKLKKLELDLWFKEYKLAKKLS